MTSKSRNPDRKVLAAGFSISNQKSTLGNFALPAVLILLLVLVPLDSELDEAVDQIRVP
jgi:hypothetical protein